MKACIFDLDGTLTNTLESMTYSVNLTLKEMGLSQITKDQCRMFVGNGARVLIEESLKVSGDPKASRIEEGMKIYGRIFDQNCTYHVTLYEGIPEMLKALKDRGIHLAVLSNKPDRQTVKVVKEIFAACLAGKSTHAIAKELNARGRKRAFRENRIPVRHLTLRTDWELRSQRQRISEIRKSMRQLERMQALRQ